MKVASPSGKEAVPLRVFAEGLTRAERAALQVLLPRRLHRAVDFETEDRTAPGLILFAMDDARAPERWALLRRRYGEVPTVVLSRNGARWAKGVPVLRRPAKADELMAAIEQQLGAAGPPARSAPSEMAYSMSDPVARVPVPGVFDPRERLMGLLSEAYRLSVRTGGAVLVEAVAGPFLFLFAPDGRIYSSANRRALHALAAMPISECPFQLREVVAEEAAAVRMRLERSGRVWAREAFLWEVAWHSAKGRLPEGVGPETPLILRRWPDCVRLAEPFPAIALAAVFARRPISVLGAVRDFGVPVEEVAAFVSAAHALGCIGEGRDGALHRRRSSPLGVLGRLARQLAQRILGEDSVGRGA